MYGTLPRGTAALAVALSLVVAACSDEAPTGAVPDDVAVEQALSPTAMAMKDAGGALPSWLEPRTYFANGDNVHQITGDNPQGCGLQTGLAFDGTNLIMSCWSHNGLDVLDPLTGALVTTVAIAGYSGFGAMAWDRTTGTLWACGNGGVAGFMNQAVQIDMTTGTVLSSFSVPNTCTDGLAFDGTDNTLWTSGDVYRDLHQWDMTGTHLQTVDIGGNIGIGNSGIAIGTDYFYLANNGQSQVFEVDRTFTSYNLFASFPRRIEDLECDDVTFAPDYAVIWQQDAYDRIINAFEIPAGACPFGGGGGPMGIAIDIKPGSWPNSINTKNKNGLTPVAVLTDDSFDASVLDPATITLGNDDGNDTAVAARKNGTLYASLEDVDGDGDMDLVLHFDTQAMVANGDLDSSTELLVLNGADADGNLYRGEDAVRAVK